MRLAFRGAWLACLVAFAGCGDDADARLSWSIVFGDPGLSTTVANVRARISEGGCTGDVVYTANLTPGGGAAAMDPGRLGRGMYGFWAEGMDPTCNVVAYGCQEITLPMDGSVTVTLSPDDRGAGCTMGQECDGTGRCRTMVTTDGGPIPCMGEGDACEDGSGTCHGGACCLGCWDGSECQAGGSVSACGVAGGACNSCGVGEPCSGGTCVPRTSERELSLNAEHSVLRLPDGTIYAAGSNRFMQQGPGAMPDVNQFSEITVSQRFARVASSQFTTCGITEGAGDLFCWGTNAAGSLAVNELGMRVETSPVRALVDATWIDITAGDGHLCAIKDDGTLHCWGTGTAGQTGLGNTNPAGLPTQVMGGGTWGRVASLKDHTCGIRADGTLWCWGSNSDGQLGRGSSGPEMCMSIMGMIGCSSRPLQIGMDADWVDVSTGVAHTCGIRRGGTLWCWGRGTNGELGLGDAMNRTSPERVGSATGWQDIATGEFHTCGLLSRMGTVRAQCWGTGIQGALGTGNRSSAMMPVPVLGDRSYDSIAAGWKHTCGVSVDTVLCWGDNEQRQLGLMDTDMGDELEPTEVVGLP